eukprot:11009699-Ditylum_brightwellii.AAC.1
MHQHTIYVMKSQFCILDGELVGLPDVIAKVLFHMPFRSVSIPSVFLLTHVVSILLNSCQWVKASPSRRAST